MEIPSIRTVDRNGDLWFVFNDTCRVFDIRDDELADLDCAEIAIATNVKSGGKVIIISESGFDLLVSMSAKRVPPRVQAIECREFAVE